MFKIEDKVAERVRRGRPFNKDSVSQKIYSTMKQLRPGQSFVVPDIKPDSAHALRYKYVSEYNKLKTAKFSVNMEPEGARFSRTK